MDIEQLIASEFPLDPDLIYLNHAAVAPWSRRTAEAVRNFADENLRRGAAGYGAWQETERRLRAQCAALVNAPSVDDIAFQKNTSEALSAVAHGFPWTVGDNVVYADEEFPSNRVVWESLRARGVEPRAVDLHARADPEQALLDAIDDRTRLLSASSVQYASGLRMRLDRLGDVCRRRGVAFCVDAIQGLGVYAHDVQAMRIDFLAADAHKWLLGPEGIAIFYCAADWRERLALHEYGWHMLEDAGNYDRRDWSIAASARRFECGSANMLGIHALAASLSLFADIGIGEIERRVLARAEHLFAGIAREPALELLSTSAAGRYGGIVTLRHRRRPAAELHARLRARNVICAPRGGGVRFSPHFYNRLPQLDAALGFAAE